MSIYEWTIIFTIVNFIILLIILKPVFFDKVRTNLQKRKETIEERINRSIEDKNEAEKLKLQSEKNLKESKVEGKTIVENYKVKAEKVSDEIIKDAKSEADVIIERARKEVEREVEKAKDGIKTQVVDLSVLMCQKALGETIDEEAHRKLIQDFIAKVGI